MCLTLVVLTWELIVKLVVCLQPVTRGLYQDSNWWSVCEELCQERTSSWDPGEPAVCQKEVWIGSNKSQQQSKLKWVVSSWVHSFSIMISLMFKITAKACWSSVSQLMFSKMASFSACHCASPQGQSRAEEGNRPFQEAGAGRSSASSQSQRKLCVWLHRGPGRQVALPRDLTGELFILGDNYEMIFLFRPAREHKLITCLHTTLPWLALTVLSNATSISRFEIYFQKGKSEQKMFKKPNWES